MVRVFGRFVRIQNMLKITRCAPKPHFTTRQLLIALTATYMWYQEERSTTFTQARLDCKAGQ